MKDYLLAIGMVALLTGCNAPSGADAGAATSPPPAATLARATSASVTPPEVSSAAGLAASTRVPASAAAADSIDDGKAVDDAIDNNLGDHQRYRTVIDAFQKAVAGNDAAAVAALVQYPIVVSIQGHKTTLKNEKQFIARYNQLMTSNIRNAIVGTRYADLFVNYKGVMFGRGQAWINGICRDDKCAAFDVKVVTLQSGPE